MSKPPVGSHPLIPTSTPTPPPLIVWAWGNNNVSQLGNGTHVFGSAPAPVNGPANAPQFLDVTAISAGYEHALALKRDGTLWAWGQNTAGQLGDGTRSERPAPIQVHGDGGNGFLTGVVAIAAADGHSLAVDTLGQVWAWGDNADGQLGDGTFAPRPFPARVHGPGGTGFLTGVVSVAGGSAHSLALKSDGTVWAWGLDVSGQLGNGQFVSSFPPGIPTPVQVHAPTGSGFLNNVAGAAAGNSHSLLVNRSTFPSAFTMGLNSEGRLGDGTHMSRNVPVPVTSLGDLGARGVAGGLSHSVALRSDGTVLAWGGNSGGQLGDGSIFSRATAAVVLGPGLQPSLTSITAISSTRDQSLALRSDGTVWTWGTVNGGTGSNLVTAQVTRPVQVVGRAGVGFLTGAIAVASGGDFNLAIAPAPPSVAADLMARSWYRGVQQDPVTHGFTNRDILGAWVGNHVFETTPSTQTILATSSVGGTQYIVRIENDGSAADSFTINGGAGTTQWIVQYHDAPVGASDVDPAALPGGVASLPDISAAVTASAGWRTPSIAPGAHHDIVVFVKSTGNGQPAGGYPPISFLVSATSVANPLVKDVFSFRFNWFWVG